MDKILAVWQPVGYSTYQITNAITEKFNTKGAHTGVLDPLAEGVIVILLGEERLNKIEYAGWKKTYEFEVCFGISTDSYDGMGLVTEIREENQNLSRGKLKNALESMVGKYEQEVPLYSAVKVKGKKLFLYPKEGLKVPDLPKKSGQVYDIELLEVSEKKFGRLAKDVLKNLEKIKSGEFRQSEITDRWNRILENAEKDNKQDLTFQTAKIRVTISRGMYIRSLSQDIAKKLGTIGFVTSLVRTQNGKYTKKDCKNLRELFGGEFSKDIFTSKFSVLN